MKNDFFALVFSKRIEIFLILIAVVNLFKYFGRWDVFFSVLVIQVLLGQVFYSFLRGDRMVFGGGFTLERDCPSWVRQVFGWFSIACFISLFFID